jgi:hypothetical protein
MFDEVSHTFRTRAAYSAHGPDAVVGLLPIGRLADSHLVAPTNRPEGKFNCLRGVPFEVEAERPTVRECSNLGFQVTGQFSAMPSHSV